MKARVRKWGNSLALRIPKAFAEGAGLRADALVELSLSQGKLVVQLLAEKPFSLERLLEGVTLDNLHGEWDSGPPVDRGG
jgi:antitoxin MazE